MSAAVPAGSAVAALEKSAFRKIGLHLLPFLLVCQGMAALDRANVGYAILQMKPDLGFTDLIYGTGAAAFFLAYFLFEVPSNLIMERIGARKTIARIMFCWGLVSAGTMFVTTPAQFYFARFLLGFFEAGFFPGILLYLTYWYPARRRSSVMGLFFCAITVSGMFGGPVSTWIMHSLDGVAGLRGWHWVFVLEGLPSTALGIAAWFVLVDQPQAAKWLTAAEKALVAQNIAADRAIATGVEHNGFLQVVRDPRVWLLCLINFAQLSAVFTMTFWLPTMIRELGVADLKTVGVLTALPYTGSLVAMLWYGRRSDARGERRRHYSVAAVAAGLCLAASTLAGGSLWASLLLLTLACSCLGAAMPVFWAIPPAYLSQKGLAVGLALVTCTGQLGGMVAGVLIGAVRDATGGSEVGIVLIGTMLAGGGLLVLAGVPAHLLRERPRAPAAPVPLAGEAAAGR